MNEATARPLRFLTLQTVGAVAVVHLVAGGMELARLSNAGLLGRYLTGEVFAQPEPLLFTVSGLAILVGVVAVGAGHLDYRRAYLLGILAMVVFVVGWLAWHTAFDHGFALSESGATESHGHDHENHSHQGLYDVVVSHYVEPLVFLFTGASQPGQVALAAVSKTLELVAFVLLAVLLLTDPRVKRD